MRLLLDASHQRAGGGLQVALATVDAMACRPDVPAIEVLCVEGSAVSELGRRRRLPVVTVPDSKVGRVRELVRGAPRLDMHRYDCVYTIFGPPIRNRGRVVNVVGIAYSNLFYPEVNFWRGYPAHRRLAFRTRDRLRLAAIRQADAWIFETEAMRTRAVERLRLEPERATVIHPAPSPFIRQPACSEDLAARLDALPARPRVLLAAGWHANKNTRRVPAVARACRTAFGESPLFVLTLDPSGAGANELRRLAADLHVSQDLCFLGSVDQRSIGQLLGKVDCVMLLSELESFSNNVIEAFVGGLPLVVSDRDWARAACRDAAVYVEPHRPGDVAEGLMQAMGPQRGRLVANGARLAETLYLTPQDRAVVTARFLDQVRRMGLRGGDPA